VRYEDAEAAAFAATRHLRLDGLGAWRDAVARHLRPAAGTRLLDLGAGTGMWAAAFTGWYGIDVVAVEPSAAMRARSTHRRLVAGDAGAIPLRDASVDAAWLSTVIHHLPDLPAAARELRRVVRPGGPVLIRSVFPGRHRSIMLFRFFPEAVRVVDRFPGTGDVRAAFDGFSLVALEPVPQVSYGSLAEAATTMRREAHSPLLAIGDDEYAAGLARLRAAALTESGPVVDAMDLLVLR
jgi:SAM-dependent methyltransferase